MVCRTRIRVTSPDGTRADRPLDDAIEDAEGEETEVEQWTEVARTIKTINVSGVEIDRIVKTTFEKPSGKRIQLVFAEAQEGVDVDDITTEL